MINAPFTVFVSGWRSDSSLFDNLKRQALLGDVLRNHAYNPEVVLGKYGQELEQSYAVQVYHESEAERISKHVGAVFQQACVGLLDNQEHEFRLVYPSGKYEIIGKFVEITEQVAEHTPSCSFWHGLWWCAA